MCSTLHFSSKKRMCQHHFLYFILKNIKSFSYSQLSNYTKNSTALGHGDGACYKITLRDFVVNCTLPVNTSASLNRRRVSTGVFTNQACAVNRNRSTLFITRAISATERCRVSRLFSMNHTSGIRPLIHSLCNSPCRELHRTSFGYSPYLPAASSGFPNHYIPRFH